MTPPMARMCMIGIVWSTHLWAGAIMLAGVVGLLLSYLMPPPYQSEVRRAMANRYW